MLSQRITYVGGSGSELHELWHFHNVAVGLSITRVILNLGELAICRFVGHVAFSRRIWVTLPHIILVISYLEEAAMCCVVMWHCNGELR